MTGRERSFAAMNFQKPDMPAAHFLYSPPGFLAYGEKFNELLAKYVGDDSGFTPWEIPVLKPEQLDETGRYYEIKNDEWGTTWEYRVYGAWGHPIKFPLADLEAVKEYVFPKPPDYVTDAKAREARRLSIIEHKKKYLSRMSLNGGDFFQNLIGTRGFENALCDLVTEDSRLIDYLDRLCEYNLKITEAAAELKPDVFNLSDDYGTNDDLIFSKEIFTAQFLPRWKKVIKPLKDAGIHVYFHSCGKVDKLFESFKEMGVDSIWPQQPAYSMRYLADKCRDMRLGVAIHTDRGETMQRGTPEDVRELVGKEMEIYRPQDGGSWFHIEIDHGFPYENTKVLIEAIFSYRK